MPPYVRPGGRGQHETGNTVAPFPALSARVRWYCARTIQRACVQSHYARSLGRAAYNEPGSNLAPFPVSCGSRSGPADDLVAYA